MACDDRYLYTSPWFYLFLLALILFIVFIIVIENHDEFKTGGIPTWVWMIFIFILLFLFVSFILYYYHIKNYQCPVVEQQIQQVQLQPLIPHYVHEDEPCSIPTSNLVEERIYQHEDMTVYQYTDADVAIPFSALNPYV